MVKRRCSTSEQGVTPRKFLIGANHLIFKNAPAPGGRVWQGKAVGDAVASSAAPVLSHTPPASCLKVRSLFEPSVEQGDVWPIRIQDAVLEKCGSDHAIQHMVVDKASPDGTVYIKFESEAAAGRGYAALHGWWFDGKLVTVKYLRLERYHARFPDAVASVTPLSPSNQEQLSLSKEKAYRSVLEF